MIEFSLDDIDASWHQTFEPFVDRINAIHRSLDWSRVTPARNDVYRVFTRPVTHYRVVIMGQDPYPGNGVADGLAFSQRHSDSVPASLRNIYKEYVDDLQLPLPTSTDLSPWWNEGVALLNRTLTTYVGESNTHLALGWKEVTHAAAQRLAAHNCVAILWGRNAQELKDLFPHRIESVHPSPLSARNGFFGSKPFTRTNTLLAASRQPPINWQLP